MEPLLFDHIAIGAVSLADGNDYVQRQLGVEVPKGGAHPRMGTHNRLMKLEGDSFFEIIAIEPSAAAPERPRWFGLDDETQKELLSERPRPICWVAGTRNIESVLAGALRHGIDLGEPTEMIRGDLKWLISLPADGSLPENGTLPVIIQWLEGPHPARRMADFGIRLNKLFFHHPDPEALENKLQLLGIADQATVKKTDENLPFIEAVFLMPDGDLRTL